MFMAIRNRRGESSKCAPNKEVAELRFLNDRQRLCFEHRGCLGAWTLSASRKEAESEIQSRRLPVNNGSR
jgi:hypothetical protein